MLQVIFYLCILVLLLSTKVTYGEQILKGKRSNYIGIEINLVTFTNRMNKLLSYLSR